MVQHAQREQFSQQVPHASERRHAYAAQSMQRVPHAHTPSQERINQGRAAQERMTQDQTGSHVRPTKRHMRPARQRRHYIPALDGLRAFAVLGVIFYHMGLGWAPGGLLGVTVFFVISGYLINGQLVAEHDRTGSISLKRFWFRRARRLLPAILLAIAGTAALCTLFNHVLLDKMRPDLIPTLLFYNNWWQIFGDVSYFEQAGQASPLKHFWSLSIEEQFYVVWPLILIVLYRVGLKATGIRRVALVLAIASAVEMVAMYDPHNPDPSRMYYGTDTRAISLLLGVWLAFAAPSVAFGRKGRRRAQGEDARPAGWLFFNVIGLLAFAGLVALVVVTNGYGPFSYQGGIALISVLAALVIAVAVVPHTWVARILSASPLVWIGKRSYGMYLWHFPLLLLTTDPNSTLDMPWQVRVAQLALIFAVAAVSYAFIEDPIRKGAIGTWAKRRRAQHSAGYDVAGPVAVSLYPDHPRAKRFMGRLRVGVSSVCVVAVVLVGCIGVIAAPRTDFATAYAGAAYGRAAQSVIGDNAQSVSGTDGGGTDEGGTAEDAAGAQIDTSGKDNKTPASKAQESNANTNKEAKKRYKQLFKKAHYNDAGDLVYAPLLIGDSVSLGAEAAFYDEFKYGHLDSVVSRNIWESPYEDYRDAKVVGDYVVFCLGTNNAVADWQIDEDLLGAVEKDKKVILVNTRSPQEWCTGTNWEFDQAKERNSKIVAVVDWYSASEGHDEYFAGDGTHLTEEGAKAYIALIKDAILDTL